MASAKERLAAHFRRLEGRLGIDREGRTVWVWLLPPGIGIVSAVLVAFMPGLPNDVGWVYRLPFAFFALLTMTAIASIYLITFDNDHNQQAAGGDDDTPRGDDGPESPLVPSGSPPARWLTALKVEEQTPDESEEADETPRRERVPAAASR
jgi:hypothetical protein